MSESQKIAIDYINDVLKAIDSALSFVKGMTYEDFFHDEKTIYAVIHALEIIGEAVSNIPDRIKEDYPNIPWKDITGMRNKLIHEYSDVKFEIVWKTLKEDLPKTKKQFQEIAKKTCHISH